METKKTYLYGYLRNAVNIVKHAEKAALDADREDKLEIVRKLIEVEKVLTDLRDSEGGR